MTEETEWGPWIEHDGKGCPVKGQFVERIADQQGFNPTLGVFTDHLVGIVFDPGPWFWETALENGYVKVIRYRVRKPRALMQLRELVESLPAPQPGKVDA